jgi:protein SMG7
LLDHYTRFLKDTTSFYRSLIQRLVSHFNVVELHPIVAQFQLPGYFRMELTLISVDIPADGPKFQSKKIKSLVFTAVQTCLIKLGDISRYRALNPQRPKPGAKPDYGPAYGYYVLAQTLLPENGSPANQLAVLSTYSKDLLSSTYYFYRALACDEPFLMADRNLNVAFRKVLRDGVGIDGVEREDVGALIEAFLKQHAQFYDQQEYFSYYY